MPRRIIDSDSEEPPAQEIEDDELENFNSASRRRQKPSTKQKEIGKIIYKNTFSSLR
jgi:hypothetical protein